MTIFLTIIGIIGITVYYLFYRQKGSSHKLPSGPFYKWPFIGNAFDVDANAPHETFTKWRQQYGDVFTVKMFGEDIVVINGYDALYEALVIKSTDFANRPKQYRVLVMCDGKATGSAWNAWSDPKTRLLKKTAMTTFKQFGNGLEQLENVTNSAIEEIISSLQEKKGETFVPEKIFANGAICIMMIYLFGKKYHLNHPDLDKMHEMLRLWEDSMGSADGLKLDLMPWLRFVGNSAYRDIQKASQIRDSIFVPLMEERKKTVGKEEVENLCSTLFALQQQKPDLTDVDIKITIQDSFMGGVDTTSSTMASAILVLINYPEIQAQLHKEIEEIIGHERKPTMRDKANMPYTEAFIMDLMRCTSILALGLPRTTECDTVVQGHHLPKNTSIFMNLWSMHHDDKFWDKQWEVVPERFLDENGDVVSADHPNRKHFMPFGGGVRVCVAQVLARNRIFLFLTALLQKFTFKPPEGQTPPEFDPRRFRRALVLVPRPFEAQAICRG